ncbi:protein FAM189A2 isoform X4 [Xiphias gladius]|uniref:protein FAM189A2 isoform X4 n=1 Tax=Xiphias gladius TaxID=8245 RepID=UPI001A9A176F|nr:protein FAM189A2 isoform X4 [Xiphias gladius]
MPFTTGLMLRDPSLHGEKSSNVAPSGATGVLLSGYRGFDARRAVLPKPTPWLVCFFPDRQQWLSVAAARAAAAIAGLVAAAARRLHGSAVLWSFVPQQLSPHPKLMSLLGRLLGHSVRHCRPHNMEKAHASAACDHLPTTSFLHFKRTRNGAFQWEQHLQSVGRPLVNVFVLLSVVCVLLNLAGFILCCQGAQLVSSMTSCQLSEDGDVCYCCSVSHTSKCPEEKLLELHPAHSCSTMRILLKKVLFALCSLNALTTAVCLMAAALRYLQIFTARTPCMDEPRATVEEREEHTQVTDPDEFVAPAPPPSYFSTFYSYTPRLARQMLGDSVIPLPHIFGARIKGVEVFCPLDTPPPYEAVAGSSTNAVTQETEIALTGLTMNPATTPPPPTCVRGRTHVHTPDMSPQMISVSTGIVPQAKPQQQLLPQWQQHTSGLTPWKKAGICRSKSDPVLMDLAARAWSGSDTPLAPFTQTTDSSTQTSQSTLAAHTQGQVTLRHFNNEIKTPRRPRPCSLVDYKSYRDTQQLVRKILEQPDTQSLVPEVQQLVDSIRNVLQSDQEHMEEAVRCASYIEQVFTDSDIGPIQPKSCQQQPAGSSSQSFHLPPRRRPGLLHLQSCGDLSSFTCAALESIEHQGDNRKVVLRAGSRAGSRTGSRTGSHLDHPYHPRPHSLIGVFRETVL